MFECEVFSREAIKLIGLNFTGPFPSSFPAGAVKVQNELGSRKSVIKNTVNNQVVFSPYFANEIMATYFACFEVSELNDIPEGMMGFIIPAHDYVKISCTNKTIQEAYGKIFEWIGQNGYTQNGSACSIEVFYTNGREEEPVEILIPIANKA
ncbi:AraC family transcriptional regulator [Paenibacillaceae bacterium]|nr:AraC family transcriptional regulator [Paenibacillaceae bacterium]